MKALLNLALAALIIFGYNDADAAGLEINQACVATGCFSGDTPGFPVIITTPGKYYLSSDLNVEDPNTAAINVAASNVELDLGGFHVFGPVRCTETPFVCSPAGVANGIDAETYENVGIRNGQVTGFGQWGIASGRFNFVSNITVDHCRNTGLVAREGTRVERSNFFRNGDGVVLREGNIASEIVAARNGRYGIATGCLLGGGCASIRDSNVYENLGSGIYDWGGSNIVDTVISGNGGPGIENANGSSVYSGNTIIMNGGRGILLQGGTYFANPAIPVSLRDNSIKDNANNTPGGGGTFVDAGGNVCGTTLGC